MIYILNARYTFILSQPVKLKLRMKLELKSFGDLSSLTDLLLPAQSAVNKKKVMTLVLPKRCWKELKNSPAGNIECRKELRPHDEAC